MSLFSQFWQQIFPLDQPPLKISNSCAHELSNFKGLFFFSQSRHDARCTMHGWILVRYCQKLFGISQRSASHIAVSLWTLLEPYSCVLAHLLVLDETTIATEMKFPSICFIISVYWNSEEAYTDRVASPHNIVQLSKFKLQYPGHSTTLQKMTWSTSAWHLLSYSSDVDLHLSQKVLDRLRCGAGSLPEICLYVNVLYSGGVSSSFSPTMPTRCPVHHEWLCPWRGT